MRLWTLLVFTTEATWLLALSASSLKIASFYVSQDVQVAGFWRVFFVVFSCTLMYTVVYFKMQNGRIPAH